MGNIESCFNDVRIKLPCENQRVIAYNNKLNEFIVAYFKNGKFYENDKELVNITRWIENNNNIEI